MEELKYIAEQINKANRAGVYNIDESAKILEVLNIIDSKLKKLKDLEEQEEK